MSSSFSNPTECFWAVPCSSWEGVRAGDPCINPALLCVPTGVPAFEATVARGQLPVGPQPRLPTYEIPSRPNGIGLRGHANVQRTHLQDRGGRNKNCKVRAVCTDCKRDFGRSQELSRHRKDVHEQPRNCLFCGFKWTRPSNIKAHLFAKHSEKFTAEHLVMIQALRGRMVVAFLDTYSQGPGVELASHHTVPRIAPMWNTVNLPLTPEQSQRKCRNTSYRSTSSQIVDMLLDAGRLEVSL